MGERGWAALGAALPQLPALTCLQVEACTGMGDAGAAALAVGIPGASTLETINLHGCGIGDDGARALAVVMRSHRQEPALHVYLTGNAYGEPGKSALDDAANSMLATIAECEEALLKDLAPLDASKLRKRAKFLLKRFFENEPAGQDLSADGLRQEILKRFQAWVAHLTGPDAEYPMVFGTAQAIAGGKVKFGARSRITDDELTIISEIVDGDVKKEALLV